MGEAVITTERLALRRFEASDLDAYLAILGHPDVARWLQPIGSRDEAMRNMAMVEGFWQLRGTSMMAVTLREGGELIGRCGPWHPEILDGREIEVGYAVSPTHQRRGYAAEAAAASIVWAFETFRPRRVIHLVKDDNAASQAVARRVGSFPTDEFVEHAIAGAIRVWAQERSA